MIEREIEETRDLLKAIEADAVKAPNAVLMGLNAKKHQGEVYAGTVSAATKEARRRKNKAARRARRASRQ
jgi:hypothetical protein